MQQGSPADEVGLRGSYKPVTVNEERLLVGGDIITAVDAQTVTRFEDLKTIMQAAQPGEQKEFYILRDGKQVSVTVTLGQSPP